MAEYKDYYKILGVEKNASDGDIKKAFKTQARKYHPDMHPESQKAAMTEKFKDINEAYEVLSDKQKRTVYDQVGSGGYQNYARNGGAQGGQSAYGSYGNGYGGGPQYYQYSDGGGGGAEGFNFNGTGGFDASDFSDFFQQIFGGLGGMGGMGGGFSGFNTGGRRKTSSPQNYDSEADLTLDLQEAYKGGLVRLTLPNGKTAQVKFPARIADGARIKLRGLGQRTSQGAGDMYVNIKIAPNPYYRVEGNDIYKVIDISPWTAALGGQTSVVLPDGSSVNVKIPSGSRSARKLKLSGKGLGRNGDFYIQLMINNPTSLTKEQNALFEKLRQIS